jgi:hypothetical protein
MDFVPDRNAQKAKEEEIERLVVSFAETHSPLTSSQAKTLIGTFITITPPLCPSFLDVHYMTIADLGRGGGESRKLGNITLNWRRLFELVPDVTLAGGAAAETAWLIPFAALYIWMKLWKASKVKLKEEDAFVVYSLWLHRDINKKISEEDAFLKTKALAKKHNLAGFTKEKFTKIINKLLSFDCIEINEGVIWMREWVRIKY